MPRGAILAFDDTCRMVLERGSEGRTAGWLMCNPSRASHLIDDPTAGRVVHHSERAGCVRSLVGNVWPWRTPYPADLWPAIVDGRITREMMQANLDALAMIGAQAHVHIVAFGTEPVRRWPRAVYDAIDAFTLGGTCPLYCLGTNPDGYPLHPLARGKFAVRNDAELRPWALPRRLDFAAWDKVFSDCWRTDDGTYVTR